MTMPPLGRTLQSMLVDDAPTMPQAPQAAKSKPNWAGILADALAGAMGRPGMYAASIQQQRAAEQEDARWTRRQSSELDQYRQKKTIDQQFDTPDISPIERDARAWAAMPPELQAAYRAAQAARPQFIPDGMGGGQWAVPPAPGITAPTKTAPRGKLTPVTGGPTQPASGAFPR